VTRTEMYHRHDRLTMYSNTVLLNLQHLNKGIC
jgi:hypothetical protein